MNPTEIINVYTNFESTLKMNNYCCQRNYKSNNRSKNLLYGVGAPPKRGSCRSGPKRSGLFPKQKVVGTYTICLIPQQLGCKLSNNFLITFFKKNISIRLNLVQFGNHQCCRGVT